MDITKLILLVTERAAETAEAGGFIGTLGLNWKLFVAQLVNFVIVLLILWKWVFKPVAGALEARRQKIEKSVRQAEEIESRMKEFEKSRQGQIAKVRAEAEAILKKAEVLAESNKEELIKVAQEQAERILIDAKGKIESERAKMFAEIKEEVADLTIMAAEKILRSKLDEEKDKKLVQDFLHKIR